MVISQQKDSNTQILLKIFEIFEIFEIFLFLKHSFKNTQKIKYLSQRSTAQFKVRRSSDYCLKVTKL